MIETGPEEWWEDVLAGYNQLKEAGYEEIAVAGLSLGGVFSLKLGYNMPVKGIVTMCAPMTMKTTDMMYEGVLKYAREYKKYEGKNEAEIEKEVEALRRTNHAITCRSKSSLSMMYGTCRSYLCTTIRCHKDHKDNVIDPDSANVIYDKPNLTKNKSNGMKNQDMSSHSDRKKNNYTKIFTNF